MTDLRSLLQEDDPVAREGGLSADDVQRIRRRLLVAEPELASRQNHAFLALAAGLLLGTIGGILLTRASLPGPPGSVPPTPVADTEPTTRQLQFSTAGGTRVIWTFNPNLEVR